MNESELEALVDLGMSMVRDPTPERRAWMEGRIRRVLGKCRRRTYEEWEAELDAVEKRLAALGQPTEDNMETGRRLARRSCEIHRFLYEDCGAPEPEWPWGEGQA